MSPTNVLLIGATGGIGAALVDKLIPDHQAGRLHIIAATRRPEAARSLKQRGIEVRRLDLDEAETAGLEVLRPAFADVDLAFLLTGYHVRMLAQSKAAVDAAKAAGASHLVHVGASATDDTTIVHFAWHQLIEAYIERSGLAYTHLRPAAFMQGLLSNAKTPGVLTHYIGDARTNWVDSADIAEVAAAVLRDPASHAGHAYDLAAEAASLTDIADLLSKVTGRHWRYEPKEPQAFYETMTAAGADPVYMACVRNVFERTRNGSLAEPNGVFDTIEAITGRPATSVHRFLERHRESFG